MTTQEMLDERYGRRRSPVRRAIGIAALAAVLLAAGAFAWSTAVAAGERAEATTTGFEVVDERTVAIAFQVTAPAGRAFACALEAQDEDHGIVGWRVVEFEASELASRAFRETVPTTAVATTGLVNACWVT